jgi:glutathione S-transferase
MALRILRVPHSTNVERVALALAHKGLEAEWVDVDPDDRSAVVALSGQELVPVLELPDGGGLADSMAILAWLEAEHPEPPLWPADPARRAATDIALEWFDRVWKGPPNRIAEGAARAHDAADLARRLPWFEALLAGRDYLLSDALGVFDVCCFPFLKYGVLPVAADDPDPFHHVLAEHLPVTGRLPRLEAWVRRVDALPRASAT